MELLKSETFNEKTIRIYGDSENPWFVAKDVMDVLGMTNNANNLNSIPEKYRKLIPLISGGQTRKMSLINESGLYKLIMRSNKPEAEAFQDWICEEVLPKIRKNGSYVVNVIPKEKSIDYYLKLIDDLEKISLPNDLNDILIEELDKDINHKENQFLENLKTVNKIFSKKLPEKIKLSLLKKFKNEFQPKEPFISYEDEFGSKLNNNWLYRE